MYCMPVCTLRGTFHVWFLEFSLGSFGPLCKILMVTFSKGCCSPVFIHFQPNFRESMWSGEIRAITFSGDLSNFKYTALNFEENLPQLLFAIIHKVILHCSFIWQKVNRLSTPLSLLLPITGYKIYPSSQGSAKLILWRTMKRIMKS